MDEVIEDLEESLKEYNVDEEELEEWLESLYCGDTETIKDCRDKYDKNKEKLEQILKWLKQLQKNKMRILMHDCTLELHNKKKTIDDIREICKDDI